MALHKNRNDEITNIIGSIYWLKIDGAKYAWRMALSILGFNIGIEPMQNFCNPDYGTLDYFA